MGVAHSEILSSTSRSGSPRRVTGGVCRRPHYPHPHDSFKSFFSVAGTVPIGTELEVPISVIDQDLSVAYLTVTFQTPEMPTAQQWTMGLDQTANA